MLMAIIRLLSGQVSSTATGEQPNHRELATWPSGVGRYRSMLAEVHVYYGVPCCVACCLTRDRRLGEFDSRPPIADTIKLFAAATAKIMRL